MKLVSFRFGNHENSKKHKENVVFLKAQMEAEEENLGEGDLDEDTLDAEQLDEDLDDVEAENGPENQPKTK
jgi:hypothetical protein